MKNRLAFLIKIYAFLLRLYPTRFRTEFEEQMLQDFSDFVDDSHKKGKFALLQVCIREFFDFPVNLLKVYYREVTLLINLLPEPANHAVRGALGFGAGFAFLSTAGWWVSGLIYALWKPIIEYLSAFSGEASQADWLYMFPFATYLVVTSLTFGGLIAYFLGNRSNFERYVLAGAFSWLIPEILSYALVDSLRYEYYQNEPFSSLLGYSMLVLMGTFFSASHVLAENNRKMSLGFLYVAFIIYPLITYLVINLLIEIYHGPTPGFFISLMAFVLAFNVGVIALAMPDRPRQYLMLLVGSVGYFLLNRALFYVAYHTPGYSMLSGIGIAPDVLIHPFYHMAVYKGSLGILFGLLMGVMIGYQRQNNQLLIAAEN